MLATLVRLTEGTAKVLGHDVVTEAFVNVNPSATSPAPPQGLMHGTGAAADIGWVLLWSAGLVAVFAPLTMRLYDRER